MRIDQSSRAAFIPPMIMRHFSVIVVAHSDYQGILPLRRTATTDGLILFFWCLLALVDFDFQSVCAFISHNIPNMAAIGTSDAQSHYRLAQEREYHK
jgi:hypothetical protein